MRQYLGSTVLQGKVADFFATGKPVAAICHGVLLAARSGALAGRRTTCLLKTMERSAYAITAWKLGKYYRTYPAYVQDEVVAALGPGGTFDPGPMTTKRDTRTDHAHAYVVEDGNYLSARWPGDAYLFAQRLIQAL